MMFNERQAQEVERNYQAFIQQLSAMLESHRDEYALMREGQIIGFYPSPGAADRAGLERFPDDIFSIQEVTDEPIDLGFWSNVAAY